MVNTVQPERKYNIVRLFLLVSLLVIAVGLYFFHSITSDVNRSRIQIAEVENDISLLNQLQQDNRNYSKEINEIKSTLPLEYYEISFFSAQLEKLAEENNLVIRILVDEDKEEEKSGYNSIMYSLELVGSYSSVSEFLSQISKLPYHTSVDNLRISSSDGGPVTKVKFRLFML